MSACPKCNNVIDDAFGLTTCDKCGENFFAGAVDADSGDDQTNSGGSEALDNVKLADNNEPLENNDFNDLSSEESSNEDLGFPTTENSTSDFSSDEFENFREEEQEENLQAETSLANENEEVLGNDDVPDADIEDELSNKLEGSSGGDVNLSSLIEDVEQNENPSDDIYYQIEIEGIDSPMVRERVLEELDDARLGWKPEDLQIKMGRLVLENVSSTKAHVVVCSMLSLPVKVEWKQKQ